MGPFTGIVVSGSGVMHLVHEPKMNGHRPFRDALPTMCGRSLVPANYFADLDDYRQSYNVNGTECARCTQAADDLEIT